MSITIVSVTTFVAVSSILIIFCSISHLFVANVQANPYWTMTQTNSYKYGYSGAGNYYSYGHVYDMNDYMHRADAGRRVWDNPMPVSNTDSPNVVLQGGEAPHANANSTTEERKFSTLDIWFLKVEIIITQGRWS
jgi:hypothetical protein